MAIRRHLIRTVEPIAIALSRHISIRLERNNREVFSASADLHPNPLVEVAGRDYDIRIPLATMGIIDSRTTRMTIGDAQWPKSALVSIRAKGIRARAARHVSPGIYFKVKPPEPQPLPNPASLVKVSMIPTSTPFAVNEDSA